MSRTFLCMCCNFIFSQCYANKKNARIFNLITLHGLAVCVSLSLSRYYIGSHKKIVYCRAGRCVLFAGVSTANWRVAAGETCARVYMYAQSREQSTNLVAETTWL